MSKEYEEILIWHPQLVLISRKPITWRGFLKINNNTQIEIKMKVPNYPIMKDASIKFGSKIKLICGKDFSTNVTALLNNSTSVLSFLNQLQRIMNNILKEKSSNCHSNINWHSTKWWEELKNTLIIPGITVFVDKGFDIIKLTNNNISIQLKQDSTGNNSWIVVSSDLPQLKGWESLEKCVSTLSKAAYTLKTRVDILMDTYENLKIIDENCWVIDPVDPKPYHLYRRVYFNAALSLLITLNPMDPESFQEIKPLGSDNEVTKCQNIINENLNKWSHDRTMFENLLDILNVTEFPQPPNTELYKIKINDGIVNDEECCICFCLESDNEKLPSEICNNKKCQRIFHTSCLYQVN